MADRIQQRRDTAARWAQYNPILLEGEVGYVTDDPNQYKIGDGVHTWNELPLRGFDGILVHELGDSQTAAMSQQGVTEEVMKSLAKSAGYLYIDTNNTFLTSSNAIKLLDFVINVSIKKVVYGNDEPKTCKILQTGISSSEGYENLFLMNVVTDEGTVHNLSVNITDEEKSGIKTYETRNSTLIYNITIDWDKYFENYPTDCYRPVDDTYGTNGFYINIVDDIKTAVDDIKTAYLFLPNSYIRNQERNFLECISEFSLSTPNGGDVFKVLQIGRSVTSPGNTVFNVREISTNTVYHFGVKETVYSGVKSYNNENNDAKIRFRITLDWDKLLSHFDNYYAPINVETTTNGLFVKSCNNSLNDLEDLNKKLYSELSKSNSINQFNGNNQIESSEKLLLQCIRMYKVITLEKSYEFKLLQSGFSNSENHVLFYLGLRKEDTDSLTYLNFSPNDDATSVDDLSGVKRYDTEINNSEIGLVKQTVVIDWDKYKELFTNRYSSDVTTFYGRRLSVISEVQQDVSNIEESVSICVQDVEKTNINAFEYTQLTEYFRNGYVVYNVPFERNGILKKITTNIFKNDYSTMQLTLLIGRIDQRNWLIDTRTYSYSFSELGISENYSNVNLTIDLSEKNIRFKEGEVICLFSRRYKDSSDRKSFLIARNDNDSDNVLFSTSLTGVFAKNKEFSRLSYEVTYFDTNFADQQDVSNIEESVSSLQDALNASSVYTDLSTGQRYRIVVNNGNIQLKNIDYSKGLFIGSSFVNHGISEDVGWFRNGAMAPSINDHSLPNLVFASLRERNVSFIGNIMSPIAWERNYNTTFDFDTEWKPTLLSENPDVIFMHISGNSTWTEEFEAACELMIENVKKTCPLADVFIAASWHGGQKAADMRQACFNKGAIYVDLSSYKVSTSMWGTGDWYYSEDDSQYHGIYQAVISHPNDIGCLLQANAFLRSCGYNEIQGTHTITINVSGEITASTPNTTWLKDGIVTIRIESGNVTQFVVNKISGSTVEAILRTNELNENYSTYYTFTMPDEDVTVNIS